MKSKCLHTSNTVFGQQESSNIEQAVKAAEQMAQPSHEENKGAELKERLINMTHERDTYKKKLEEFQTHLEEANVCINFLVI